MSIGAFLLLFSLTRTFKTAPFGYCKAAKVGRKRPRPRQLARHPAGPGRLWAFKDADMSISPFAGFPAPRTRTAVFAAVLLLAGATPLFAQDKDAAKDPVLAKVNGAEIHQSDLAGAEEEAGQIPPMSADAK